MNLEPTAERFILHWGEMGTRWGINRTVAQIHALLYLSDKPLPADEIAATLAVARSNVSTSIRELQSWGIVRTVPVMGDRRDHFQTLTDVWEMFRIIMDERKKREIDPTLTVLRQCVQEIDEKKKADPNTAKRLHEMLEFVESMTGFYSTVRGLPVPAMARFVKMGKRIPKLLNLN